jgi:hypothetical protein
MNIKIYETISVLWMLSFNLYQSGKLTLHRRIFLDVICTLTCPDTLGDECEYFKHKLKKIENDLNPK